MIDLKYECNSYDKAFKIKDQTSMTLRIDRSQMPYTLATPKEMNPNWIDSTTGLWKHTYIKWLLFS